MERSGKLRILLVLFVILIPAGICTNRGSATAQNGVEVCSSNIALGREFIEAGPSCSAINTEEYPPIYLRGRVNRQSM